MTVTVTVELKDESGAVVATESLTFNVASQPQKFSATVEGDLS